MAAKKDGEFGSKDQASALELLWGAVGRPTRGPKPALSPERIARAAIGIADAEGLAMVSMQRVAADLDFTKMSLYRYFPGKTELIAFMIDTALGEPSALGGGDWRAKLGEWARRFWEVLRQHPWLLQVTVGQRPVGPNELGWLECAVEALAPTGLDGAEQLDAVVLVTGHVRNLAQQVLTTVTPAGVRAGSTEGELISVLAELLERHGERFPALTTAVASAAAGSAQDDALDFGLNRIFDGLELLIAKRAK
ncbi:TetR/AcrR family transcriptional regulator C-terminal domain-containing protein [Nonomuraea sp. NPDC049141]|uniref:TetR/AcrR family transcriptional regulator n=1 Tax=Nonomuraea sp. NPDC049141 TaxID=3155500 RepID=UPI0033C7972D